MTEKGKMMEAVYAAQLTQRATLVIFYLINRADKEMTCFPGVKTIARECNISERTVQRALNDLEEARFVRRESRFHEEGGQRSNLYVLGVEEKDVVEVEKAVVVKNELHRKCVGKVSRNKKEGVMEVCNCEMLVAVAGKREDQQVSKSNRVVELSPSECHDGAP